MSEKFVDSLCQAQWLLACIEGVDCGAVIPLEGQSGTLIFGRTLRQVTDRRISREQCELSWDKSDVHVMDKVPTNPTYYTSAFRLKHRLDKPRVLRPWAKLLCGQSIWQLRPRPTSYLLPSVATSKWRSRLRALFSWKRGLSVIFLLVFFIRLAFIIPHTWLMLVLLIVGTLMTCLLIRQYLTAPQERWDSAALCLHLAHCTHHTTPPRKASAHVTAPLPWADARPLDLWEDSGGTRNPGYYGPYALGHALYDIAANSRYFGGATVHTSQGVWICGNGYHEVHILTQNHCQFCTETTPSHCAHIAVHESINDVPPWCDTLIYADQPRVSLTWAQQVYFPAASENNSELTSMVAAHTLWKEYAWPPHNGGLHCPIGIDEQHNIASIDLVDDGPHGVIVGTTGSGKSEALITLLCGLARGYSPSRLRYILIDYKGGASLAPLEALPHTQCLLTDLSPSTTQRTFLALRRLCEEREELLRANGYASLTHWEEKSPTSAPPRVILACDEFTTFADIHPQLFADMLRWTAQGRALGIHILLATQRPDQALSHSILANIDFRLALRCREKTASHILIGTDQASLLPHIPGRAIIDGRGVIQCGWICNIDSTIASLCAQWAEQAICPLWIADMPIKLSPAELTQYLHAYAQAASPEQSAKSDQELCPIGLLDGIRWGMHTPLYWSGGHIRFEGTPSEKALVAQSAHNCASAIAQHLKRPLLHLGEKTHNIVKVIDALAHVDELGDVVISIANAADCMAHLENAMGQLHAVALWKRFIHLCSSHNIPLICATTAPTTLWDKDARDFSYRLVASRPAHALMQWGLTHPAPTDGQPDRFLLTSAPSQDLLNMQGETPALPLLFQPLTAPSSHREGSGSLEQATTTPTPTQRAPQDHARALVASAPPDIAAQWGVTHQICPQRWTELSRIQPDELLITELTEEIRRAALPYASQSDWLLKLRFLPPGSGIYISQGKAHCFTYEHPS